MQLWATEDAVVNLKVEDAQWNIARALIQNSEFIPSFSNPFLYNNAECLEHPF